MWLFVSIFFVCGGCNPDFALGSCSQLAADVITLKTGWEIFLIEQTSEFTPIYASWAICSLVVSDKINTVTIGTCSFFIASSLAFQSLGNSKILMGM